MSTLRHPVGPLPPQVYWRRRLLVGLGVLAVIVIIVLIIVRPGAGDPADQPTPDPTSTETASPGDPPASTEAAACVEGQVVVTAVTDATSYPVDQQPLLSFTLLNTGAAACELETGVDVQEFLIVSGDDRIWSSTDCQEPGSPVPLVLEPGVEVESTPFAWSRTRSTPDDCATADDRPAVIAGGATYRLSVTVGEFASVDDRPFILN
jgi:hypothetical protein